MPSAKTIAAARTAIETLKALRSVTGKTEGVRKLNEAIDAALAEAEQILSEAKAQQP